ncbi:aldo/keto reductase [Streptomyces oceani]|uniref:Aldo/keto reductase n=1 Tax=Streptomyces oceani TaxID=1075402 RepID=A0A1E7KJV4_9ACTN|nr:aldo/keto reductase [Streptomyces oceani]OEV04205.1 aldo/keto reductase [Streptomyces oceani]
MRYTLFGRTGLRVSELSLGTMTFGVESGPTADLDTCRRLLHAYTELGGNFLDTANIYTGGASERIVGELLNGRRDEFVLATKYTGATREGDVNSAGNHRKSLRQSVEASLRRLRTDHVDILWVHARDSLTPVEEVMRGLDDVVRSGKVLYLGVSDWPAWEIAQANTLAELRHWTTFAGSQLRYNLLDRTAERELLPQARAFDQAVLVWGPLGGGVLTGKYRRGEGGRLTGPNGAAPREPRQEAVVTEVLDIAEQGGWSPAQVALAWLRAQPGNVIPILGATKESQLADNLAALRVTLGEEATQRLDEVSAQPLGFPHDFLREPGVTQVVYGDRWPAIEDRRSTPHGAPRSMRRDGAPT